MRPTTPLPEPSPDARAHSQRVVVHIRDRITAAGGWISFADYMSEALYAPALGYYSAGSRKLGHGGDFVTAPELTPLFGDAIARQAMQLIRAGCPDILEIGAGTGALAAGILEELEREDCLPEHYYILEVSADLRERERDLIGARVPQHMERVIWLNRLPPLFNGLVIGNEVLDAMPVHLLRVTDQGIDELGVALDASGGFRLDPRPAAGALERIGQSLSLTPPYTTEISLAARGFVSSVGAMLARGAALFIDYGFPTRELYHPQRSMGTLRCHFRHRALDDPFFLPGLVDITAHVDFSAMSASAQAAGLILAGYTSQASFLINCGITALLARTSPEQADRYLPMANAVQRLLSPAEMGELFKAIAFTKGFDTPLIGFTGGDRRGAL
ncbi:MAG: class I SAM-dependent methyltransferase [Burkholderiales bacterium]